MSKERDGSMSGETWKDELRKLFEAFTLIEKAKADTREKFAQFCEFIAEPAFESLKEEMRNYRVKVRFHEDKGRSIGFELSFPGSNTDNLHYRIILPKNAYELKLVLIGRKSKSAVLEERGLEFMKELSPGEIMKIAKEDLILDILERYRDFTFSALASPD
jgi:hypothetical protein